MADDALEGLAGHIVAEAAQLGTAALLLVDTDRKTLSIAALVAWVSTPLRLGQAAFIHSAEGRPLAYATWAFLETETADRVRSGKLELLSPEDWNDGDQLWIVDIVAPYGHLKELLLEIRNRLSRTHERFDYVRVQRGRLRFGSGILTRRKTQIGTRCS